MTRIVLTLQAIEDVEAMRAYIAGDSPRYTSLIVESIDQRGQVEFHHVVFANVVDGS